MNLYLSSEAAAALRSVAPEEAERIAGGESITLVLGGSAYGGRTAAFEAEVADALGLWHEGGSLGAGLDAVSRRQFERFWRDPDQAVDASDIEPNGPIAFGAIDHGRVVASIAWHSLPRDLAERYRGAHAHGHIVLLRNRLGEDEMRWEDGDPTKGAAWDVWRHIEGDEFAALLPLLRPTVAAR